MFRSLTITAAALSIAATSLFAADTYVVDKAHSETTFTVRHLVSKVSGRFNEFDGTINFDAAKPERSTVSFTIKAASINTDNEGRDKHLRSDDFFAVEKFPEITFKSAKITPRGKDQYDVTGTLTMHGVAKEVTLPVSYLGKVKDPWGNEKLGFEVSTTLDRKEYGIVWNKALDSGGALLGDDVKITINLEAGKPKQPKKQ